MAWHNPGVLKFRSLGFSTAQEQAVKRILQQRAAEEAVSVEFIGVDSTLPKDVPALKPKAQQMNCSLAVAVVRAWLSIKVPEPRSYTKAVLLRGIEQFSWPGRYQPKIRILNGFLTKHTMN